MIVRNSEMMDFLRCRLKWNYRWNRNLKSKGYNAKTLIGTVFHKFLEIYHSIGFNRAMTVMSDFWECETSQVPDEFRNDQELSEMLTLLSQLAHWYHEYWSHHETDSPVVNHHNWNVLATENTYYINLRTLEWTTERPDEDDPDLWYECTLDLLVEIDGKVWVVDHKTVSSLDYFVKAARMDRQISRYLFAASVIFPDKEIGGMIYNLIKKEVPKEPEVLKSGGFSKRKDQRTTYNKYLEALLGRYEVIPDEYNEILEILKAKETKYGNDFLYRVIVKRNAVEINNAMNEFLQVAEDIKAVKNRYVGFSVYRNITKDCSWDCPYMEVCAAGMDGSDVTYLEEALLEPIPDEGREDVDG